MTSIISQEKQVVNATNSNAVISKSTNVFSIFFYLSGNYIKFGILWRKDESQRLFVSEIKNSKMRGYLNGQKVPYQNTYGKSTC